SDVLPTGHPLEQLAAGRVVLEADGAPAGDEPLVVRGAVEGLEARLLRSWTDGLRAGTATLDRAKLPPVRLTALDVDGRVTWVDDTVDPPFAFGSDDLRLQLREDPAGLAFGAEATVRGAALRSNGVLRSLDGPLDAEVHARFLGLRAAAVSRELGHYLGARVDRGTLDATADVVLRHGRVAGDLTVAVDEIL